MAGPPPFHCVNPRGQVETYLTSLGRSLPLYPGCQGELNAAMRGQGCEGLCRWTSTKQPSTCNQDFTAMICKAGPLGQSLSVKLLINQLGALACGSITPRCTFQLKVGNLVKGRGVSNDMMDMVLPLGNSFSKLWTKPTKARRQLKHLPKKYVDDVTVKQAVQEIVSLGTPSVYLL